MSGELFTILGAGGRIGRALVSALRDGGHRVRGIERATLPRFLDGREPAGHVIHCIGMTGDFRTRPLDTADAHVGIIARVLAGVQFDTCLYLSSTRVYAHATTTWEDDPLAGCPRDPSDLYNLTKLAGEALCLADPRPGVRVARLSNVHAWPTGTDTFLGQVMAEGIGSGRVLIRQAPESEKDYISLAQVTAFLPRIAMHGRRRLYNLASGRNISHAAIAAMLRARFGWTVAFGEGAPAVRFPPIETTRLRTEFGDPLSDLLQDLATLDLAQEAPCSPSTRQAVA